MPRYPKGGISALSELNIDVDKDWSGRKIAGLGAPTVQDDALRKGRTEITDSEVAAANKDGLAGTASMRTLGPGSQQAAAGNHSHTLLHDTASDGGMHGTASSVTRYYNEQSIASGDTYELTSFNLTVANGVVIEAFGMAHSQAQWVNTMKMQLLIDGVLVAESGFLSTSWSHHEVRGYKESVASGSRNVALKIKNYDVSTRWHRYVDYYLGAGSVKI